MLSRISKVYTECFNYFDNEGSDRYSSLKKYTSSISNSLPCGYLYNVVIKQNDTYYAIQMYRRTINAKTVGRIGIIDSNGRLKYCCDRIMFNSLKNRFNSTYPNIMKRVICSIKRGKSIILLCDNNDDLTELGFNLIDRDIYIGNYPRVIRNLKVLIPEDRYIQSNIDCVKRKTLRFCFWDNDMIYFEKDISQYFKMIVPDIIKCSYNILSELNLLDLFKQTVSGPSRLGVLRKGSHLFDVTFGSSSLLNKEFLCNPNSSLPFLIRSCSISYDIDNDTWNLSRRLPIPLRSRFAMFL